MDAPLAAVEAVVWGELLVSEGATCLRRLSDDELIYVQRRDNGSAVVHARITRAPTLWWLRAAPSSATSRRRRGSCLPLQGYVLAANGGTTQLTWVREADVADASALHAVLAANDARASMGSPWRGA